MEKEQYRVQGQNKHTASKSQTWTIQVGMRYGGHILAPDESRQQVDNQFGLLWNGLLERTSVPPNILDDFSNTDEVVNIIFDFEGI